MAAPAPAPAVDAQVTRKYWSGPKLECPACVKARKPRGNAGPSREAAETQPEPAQAYSPADEPVRGRAVPPARDEPVRAGRAVPRGEPVRADRSVPVVARPVEGVPLRTAQGAEIPVATVEAAWPADGNGRVYRRRRYDPYLDDPYYDPCATLSIELCPRSAQVAHQPAH